MNISTPFRYVVNKAMGVATRTIAITVVVLVAVVAVAAQNFLVTPDKAYAAPASGTCFAYTTAGSNATITNYYDYENNNSANPACPKTLEIPASIEGYTVTTIGDWAFVGKQLASVVIPDSVIIIGEGAFVSNFLTSVTIPNSVTGIGDVAFLQNQLTSLTLGSSVATIGHNAFNSNQLTALVIPDSVTTIGDIAFANNQLTSLTLGNSVTAIGVDAFSENFLTSVTIPNSVTIIDADAFQGNFLTLVTIPNSVTTIGDRAFLDNSLISVIIEGNPILGEEVFRYNGLDRTALPGGLYGVEYYEYYRDNAAIVQIYAADPAFATAHPSGIFTQSYDNYDYNGEFVSTDTYVIGAFITNPASVTIQYKNSAGTSVADTLTFSGVSPGGMLLAGYHVSDLMTADTGTVDVFGNHIYTADFSLYYRLGGTVDFSPLTIAGYVMPAPQSLGLQAGDNSVVFTYLTQAEIDGTGAMNGSQVDSTNTTLASTGIDWLQMVMVGILLFLSGGTVIGLRKVR